MKDSVLLSFLDAQYKGAMALSQESDIVDIAPVGATPYQRYMVQYRCNGLVKNGEDVIDAQRFEIGITLHDNYLRSAEPPDVLTWLSPVNVYHPNLRFPWICPGHLRPGTDLVDLIFQVYEIISYQNVTMLENNALNQEACGWARRNIKRFPVDSRPLKRRKASFRVEKISAPRKGKA